MADDSGMMENLRFSKLVQERLERLIKGTRGVVAEQEPLVLRLGEGVHRVWSAASDLSGRAGELVENLSGSSMENSVQRLVETLEKLNVVCDGGGGGESLGYLDEILSMASSLDSYLNEFKKIVRTLQILGMTTRIESARLGSEGRGFSTLADDVEKLAFNIVTHSSQIKEKYAVLETVVSQASTKTREIAELQSSCFIDVRDKIRSNMSALEAFLDSQSDRASDFAGTSSEISTQVGEAVSSMQFHDIVRQRVEHVEEAFTEVVQELKTSSASSAESLAAWMVHVCEMQSRQLVESGESFHTAIEGLKNNLMGIGEAVESMCASMAQDASACGLDDPDHPPVVTDKYSPLQTVESGINKAMSGVKEYAELESEINTLMKSVVDIVKDMAVFVDDIEEVGSEIELIALNASVRAAHTGEKGAALGVLAIEIQSLSARAREHTVGVADVLNKVSDISDTLVEYARTDRREEGMVAVIAGLGTIIEELSETNRQAESESLVLISESKKMIKDIRSITEKVTFHEGIRGKLAAFSRQADDLAAEIAGAVPESAHAPIPEHLKAKLDRYTMETERDVHRSVFGSDGGDEEDGGDDIELFSDGDEQDDNIELF